jgi:hypothetical protein
LAHAPPPQSTAVSVPFLTPSAQPAVWQIPLLHTLLAQSDAALHFLPVAHRAHAVFPPQSTSVSPPFCTPSLHVAA